VSSARIVVEMESVFKEELTEKSKYCPGIWLEGHKNHEKISIGRDPA
jgi:hypothetical protein